jgi:prophage maintenance system killer protein
MFIEMNSWRWTAYPSIDDAVRAVLSVASGEWNEQRTADWLRERIARSSQPASKDLPQE